MLVCDRGVPRGGDCGSVRRPQFLRAAVVANAAGVVNEVRIAWPKGELMRCSKCGVDNREGRGFCGRCGSKLGHICAKCWHNQRTRRKLLRRLWRHAHYTRSESSSGLAGDGLDLNESRPTSELIEGERKTVTALFADIRGSTELEQDLDPEEARAIIDPALN